VKPDRRRLLAAATAAATLGIAGCAAPPPVTHGFAVQVAPGVFVVRGAPGAADPANLGRIGNMGFVVGPGGVVAIDTGTSYEHGRALLTEITRVTPLPVKLAIVTHTRPEFLFGGGAFRDRGIPVRMHRRTATLMAARCETCLKTLKTVVGEAPMAGTALYKPDQLFDDSHALELIGRPLRVLHFGHSSGPGDTAVLDVATGTLFAGGLLDASRVPDIQDSELPGWHRALRELQALAPRTVVPGHGAPGGPALIDGVERYLASLETKVRSIVASGASLLGAADDADLPEYAGWDQYDTIHRRNASVAFLRFERELLFKQP
jgi:glyoxylase-like metal-dependent hydrolase (beta-lactamase superfamily II)